MKKYIAIALLLVSGTCLAQDVVYPKSVVAVCKNPTGYAIHLKPDGSKTETKDGFTDATWTFLWDGKTPDQGKVLTTPSQRWPDLAKTLIFMTEPRAVNFLSVFGQGVWNYTIFLDKKTMIASKHMDSEKHDRIIGSVFHAKCDISMFY